MLWFLLACVLGVSTEEEQTTISLEHTKAVHYVNTNNALKSSVKLIAYDDLGKEIAHGSGNYFKIGGDYFIITAAHNMAPGTLLEAEDGYRSLKLHPIIVDVTRDIAILVPEEKLRMVKAVDYRLGLEEDMTGNTIVYAGYPADLGKSTFTGTIANDQRYMMVIQSFALPGSSGSVVFNTKGRPIGVIHALRLGFYEFNPYPQMHSTLVYCQKLRDYDRYAVRGFIERWKRSRSEP